MLSRECVDPSTSNDFYNCMLNAEEVINGVQRVTHREFWRVRKRYRDLKLISNASPNKVCEAFDSVLGCRVAIKWLQNAFVDENHARKYCRELFLLPRLHHPNVIKILDAFSDVELDSGPENMDQLYLVLSYTDWDLHQYLMHLMTQKDSCDLCRHRKHNQRSTTSNEVQFVTSSNGDETKCCEQDELSMPQVQSFMFQIISGLHYLHRNGLMHRDLNTSNVGLTLDGQVFLLDFDFSRHVNNRNKEGHSIFIANQNYRAPEIVLNPGQYGKQVDIWSAGCIFAELLSVSNGLRSRHPIAKQFLQLPDGSGPFQYFTELLAMIGAPPDSFFDFVQEKESFKAGFDELIKDQQSEQPQFDSRYSFVDSCAKDLLRRMLAFDPKERITADQALRHKFFEEFHCQSDLESETSDESFDQSALDPNNNSDSNNNSFSNYSNCENENLVCPVDVMDKPTSILEIKNLVFAELHNFPRK